MRASFPLLVAAQLLIGCASDTFTVPSDGGAVDGNIDATVDGAMTDGAPDAMPSDAGVPVLAESLKSGLYLWLRADDPGITLDAGRVLVWPDRSGSGADGTVAPPCDSPTIDPAPRGSFGLRPVSFDGGLNGLRLSSCFQDFSQGVTAFIVAQVHPLAASVPFLELTANGYSASSNGLRASALLGRIRSRVRCGAIPPRRDRRAASLRPRSFDRRPRAGPRVFEIQVEHSLSYRPSR